MAQPILDARGEVDVPAIGFTPLFRGLVNGNLAVVPAALMMAVAERDCGNVGALALTVPVVDRVVRCGRAKLT